jgi:protein-tyrosine-phosphatase
MASAFAKRIAHERVLVHSAGSEPASALNPAVVDVMAERGIDLAAEAPTALTEDMARRADVVVTMGCGDACPVYPGKRYVDWQLEDPAGQSVEVVRGIRDEIEGLVRGLVDELIGPDATPPQASGTSGLT